MNFLHSSAWFMETKNSCTFTQLPQLEAQVYLKASICTCAQFHDEVNEKP